MGADGLIRKEEEEEEEESNSYRLLPFLFLKGMSAIFHRTHISDISSPLIYVPSHMLVLLISNFY